jgi:glycosyltransferase involved in cell wall biosynthesis
MKFNDLSKVNNAQLSQCMQHKPLIIASVTTDLVTDQRVQKVCNTLQKNGYEVLLIGRKLKDSPPLRTMPFQQKRFKLPFQKGPFFYASYNIYLFFYLLFKRFDLLLANDLDTLSANFLVSKIRSKRLIYDSHELFTEVPELLERKKVKKTWQFIESLMLPSLKYAYTVSPRIAKAYHDQYGIKMSLVRNFPLRQKSQHAVKQEKQIIYQGALNEGRGLELLIDSMCYLPEFQLKIAGSGDLEGDLKRKVAENNLEDRVHFLGRLEPDKLRLHTEQSALGVSLEEMKGLSYQYALPNKLFDYLQAGTPIIYADLVEVKELLKAYNVGELLKSRKPKEFAAQLEDFLLNPNYAFRKQEAIRAAQSFCWEKEEQVLLNVFKSALRGD